ncbi:MAG TPA: COX15/CtaA family protein [Dehalococcoidia bacterium]|nr:COX15/CtaA family protein [Dehalococcoidia bacterium]
MTGYQKLTVITAVATLVLIGVGALVRTTGSGLGCPDWPLCHGQIIPPAEKTAIIEYSHRTLAMVVGFLIMGTAWVTLRSHSDDRPARMLAIISLPLLFVQAWLGKVTVERELPAEAVMIHLGTALTLLAILAVIAAFSILGSGRRRVESAERASVLRIAHIATIVTAGVLMIGAYTVGSHAGVACTSWPGCAEGSIPFVDGGRLQHIHWIHRITVVAGLAAIGVLAMAATNMRERVPALERAVWAALALYGLQIAIGALNIWSDFAEIVLVAHLAVGSAIWALLVLILVVGRFEFETDRAAYTTDTLRTPAADPGA